MSVFRRDEVSIEVILWLGHLDPQGSQSGCGIHGRSWVHLDIQRCKWRVITTAIIRPMKTNTCLSVPLWEKRKKGSFSFRSLFVQNGCPTNVQRQTALLFFKMYLYAFRIFVKCTLIKILKHRATRREGR